MAVADSAAAEEMVAARPAAMEIKAMAAEDAAVAAGVVAVAGEVELMPRHVSHSTLRTSRGLSLLELVLALALSVVVIGLVSMALRFQLQTFEQRRDRIEQAALGRAILRNISDDLRSAIAFRPMDLQGVSTVTGNATQSLGGVGAAAGGTGQASAATTTPMSPAATGQSATAPAAQPVTAPASNTSGAGNNTLGSGAPASAAGSNAAQTGSVATAATQTGAAAGEGAYVAGLYGDQYSLQFDMTRLPRLDEYSAIVSDAGVNPITQIPTDIRTISYYLSGSTPITQASAAQSRESGLGSTASSLQSLRDTSLPPEGRGLVRQERDRSLAAYSEVKADFSDLSQDTGEDLLAEEVTRLEFQYFDGYQWWPSWDSDDRGGLPIAIEILVGLADAKPSDEAEPTTNQTASNEASKAPQELIYRLVVRIPTAEPLDPNEIGEEEETTDPNIAANANTSTNGDAANTNSGTNANATGTSPTGGGVASSGPMAGGTPGGGTPGGGQQPGGFGMGAGSGQGSGANGGSGGRGNRGGGSGPTGRSGGGGGGGMPRGGGNTGGGRGGGTRGGGS